MKQTVDFNEKAMKDPTLTKEVHAVLTMVHQQVVKYNKVDEMIVALNSTYAFDARAMMSAIKAGSPGAPIESPLEDVSPAVRHEL